MIKKVTLFIVLVASTAAMAKKCPKGKYFRRTPGKSTGICV